MSDAQRYPLSWPSTWKRTTFRQTAKFSKKETRYGEGGSNWTQTKSLTVGDGLSRLEGELRRLGAQSIVISSNLRRNQDGSITASQAKMLGDPGVAVYFKLKGKPTVLACDAWNSAADNMAAIAGHIYSLRAMERYGVGTVEQAFAGYAALPPAGGDWRAVLGIREDVAVQVGDVEAAYKRLAKQHHPDVGGDANEMYRINAAWAAARKELGA